MKLAADLTKNNVRTICLPTTPEAQINNIDKKIQEKMLISGSSQSIIKNSSPKIGFFFLSRRLGSSGVRNDVKRPHESLRPVHHQGRVHSEIHKLQHSNLRHLFVRWGPQQNGYLSRRLRWVEKKAKGFTLWWHLMFPRWANPDPGNPWWKAENGSLWSRLSWRPMSRSQRNLPRHLHERGLLSQLDPRQHGGVKRSRGFKKFIISFKIL